ncbi:hypothetical protein [Okeania sp. SIO3I5]|nr:hypothetical protein [Okeania sp. SIO3I5]
MPVKGLSGLTIGQQMNKASNIDKKRLKLMPVKGLSGLTIGQ